MHPTTCRTFTLLVLLLFSPPAAAQRQIYKLDGTIADEYFGYAVAGIGDVDKDGHADVLIGSPRLDRNGPRSGAAFVISGRHGQVLQAHHGPVAGSDFGWAVASVGDVNEDGWPDFAVGAPFEDNAFAKAGAARVYSGKDGSLLREFKGGAAGEILGISVTSAGDVDKDGVPDVIVGGHGGNRNGPNTGLARVFSGKTGLQLHRFDGDSATDFFGHAVGTAGDIDRDGHADLVVGIPDDDDSGTNAGSARVFSGRTGAILYHWNGDWATDNFGHSVAGIGDVNTDGWPDVVIGGPQFTLTSLGTGYVRVFSGKDGSTISTIRGDRLGDFFGEPVSPAGDWNNDGRPDFAVGAPKSDLGGTDAGLVKVFSGKDSTMLASFTGPSTGAYFGYVVRLAGDVNEDGIPDLVVGAPREKVGSSLPGTARILSSSDLTLTANVHTISLATGGAQAFQLYGGGAQAGRFYLLVGSLSGRKPGVDLTATLHLPLNFDNYMLFTVTQPNSLVAQSFAALDSSGRGSAVLGLPPGLPSSLAGLRFDHAYFVMDVSTLSLTLASNAVVLTLTP